MDKKVQTSEMSNSTQSSSTQLVYILVRWGQIIGVYANLNDATQVANASIAKGQYCDIITKPIQ